MRRFLYALLGLILFFTVWDFTGRFILHLPQRGVAALFMPSAALSAFGELLSAREFWEGIAWSLGRVFTGLAIALTLGLPLGIFIGRIKTAHQISALPLQFLRMISPLSWMPAALFLLPGFEPSMIFLLSITSIWPVALASAEGARRVDPQIIRMAGGYGAGRLNILTEIILPFAAPYLITGSRTALGITWVILVPAEFLGADRGLGYLVNDAREILAWDRLSALVLAIGILGALMDYLLRRAARRLGAPRAETEIS